MSAKTAALSTRAARQIWLHAQRLDTQAPFGNDAAATTAAVEHLGYVQIDTINVIERAHHHILFTRIPGYRRAHLVQAQSVDKSVFEYWTHALAYIPTRDLPIFLPDMRRHRRAPTRWGQTVTEKDYRRVIRTIRENGPITIRDFEDEVLVEKEHLWASRKPSKGALQLAFWDGVLTISERSGMLKTYELMDRHFGWNMPPKGATERQILDYLIDTGLRAQGLVSIDSLTHTRRNIRPALLRLLQGRVRRKELVPVDIESAGRTTHWATPEAIEATPEPTAELVHILSPFDPLIIQRKRTSLFFGYDHVFEAYVKKENRRFGYFALPVTAGDEIVAAIDLKTDRSARRLLIQSWHWIGLGDESFRQCIEEALNRFEQFQLDAG